MSEKTLRETTRDEFVGQIQDGVRKIAREFTQPDDDWQPVMFLDSDEGEQGQRTIAGFAPEFFEDADSKNQLVQAMIKLIEDQKAFRYGLLMTAWLLKVKKGEAPPDEITDHPDRDEVLILFVGDSDGETHYTALVLRDGEQPPGLAPWESPFEGCGEMVGRLVGLHRALVP